MKFIKTQTADSIYLDGLIEACETNDQVIIHIHGMQWNFYTENARYFDLYPSFGLSIIAGENRGSYVANLYNTDMSARLIGGAYETFEDSVYDIAAWIAAAAENGYSNIWLQGHSLGAMKIIYYMYKTHDPRVSGLILVSPSDQIGLLKDPVGRKDHQILFPEAEKLVKDGMGEQLLSRPLWGSMVLSARTYLNLFNEDAHTNIFHYYDSSRSWEVINDIKVPVIAFTGTRDDGIEPVINPVEAMKILKRELIHASKVRTVVFDNADHSFVGFEKRIIEETHNFIMSSPSLMS